MSASEDPQPEEQLQQQQPEPTAAVKKRWSPKDWWNTRPHIVKVVIIIGALLVASFSVTIYCTGTDDPYAAQEPDPNAPPTATPLPTPTATPLPTLTPTPEPLGLVPLQQHLYQRYRFYHFLHEYRQCLAHANAVQHEIDQRIYAERVAAGDEGLTPPELPVADDYLAEYYALRDMPHTVASLLDYYRRDACPEIRAYHQLEGRTRWLLEWLSPAPGGALDADAAATPGATPGAP